jgi:predicted RNase H-like nuclease (RuvC/YqgF family)
MSESVTGASDAVVEPASTETVTTQVTESDVVSKKDHERALADMLKFKNALREKEKSMEKLQAEREELRMQGLRAKEEWKTIAEEKEALARQLEQDLKATKQAVLDSKRYEALKVECMKLGIIDHALDDITQEMLQSVDVEVTSTGRVNVLNAKQAAEDIKLRKPHWFGKPSAPSVNNGVPTVGTTQSPVTPKQVLELQAKYKKTRDPADLKAYETAMRSLGRPM